MFAAHFLRPTTRIDKKVNFKLIDTHPLQELAHEFPGRVHAIRYEDICMDPPQKAQELFDYFGLPMHQSVQDYAQKVVTGRKNPIETALHWRKEMSFERILEIQEACTEAMSLWGYKVFNSSRQVLTESPILSFKDPVHR